MNKTGLHLVPPQASAAQDPWPTTAGLHPDQRLRGALQAARQAGWEAGERDGYTTGWRRGVGQALLGGMVVGALAMYAGTELVALIQAMPR